jgi:signal recognition particle receptor subunit beta
VSTINPESKEISVKIVYYGPGLGGKTSSLQAIHRMLDPKTRGQLISLATGSDRTLYFDFLPVKARFKGFTVRLQLYTVPGQVHYNSTRKLVLQGCDGVVFVADSQRGRTTANEESLTNLEENLVEQGANLRNMPLVLQYNKRDIPGAVPAQVLNDLLNPYSSPTFETVALTGEGIFETLKAITSAVLADLSKKMPAKLPTSKTREITGHEESRGEDSSVKTASSAVRRSAQESAVS